VNKTNPNVVTCDGMFHRAGKVGKYIVVDGRRFPVDLDTALGGYKVYVVGRPSVTVYARTRAYLSAYIHMALFPQGFGN
jgi:hypothetical protein